MPQVPREPTEAMIQAMKCRASDENDCWNVIDLWRAGYDAWAATAPAAPTLTGDEFAAYVHPLKSLPAEIAKIVSDYRSELLSDAPAAPTAAPTPMGKLNAAYLAEQARGVRPHDMECPYVVAQGRKPCSCGAAAPSAAPEVGALVARLETYGHPEDGWSDGEREFFEAIAAALLALQSRVAELELNARRWDALCELWHASTEFHGTQDEDGRWSLTMIEPVEGAWTPGRWTGDTPDDAIDPLVASLAESEAREEAEAASEKFGLR